MKGLFAFDNKRDALEAISKELINENWQNGFLIDQNGDACKIFIEKDKVVQFNTIVPFGGFNSQEEADDLLKSCLILHLDQITEWLVSGDNTPLKLFFTFNEPIGYAFNTKGKEVESNKIQLCLRKDRKGNTHLGMFVSHFHPVYEFIE